MIFNETPLRGSYCIELERHSDHRGFFARCFCKAEFTSRNLNYEWVQVNNSLSKNKFTLRGMHFQSSPYSEVKLIRCIRGVIWDVIVDLRTKSPTYGNYYGTELSAENRRMLYVPQGFAHGFISESENSEILYLVSQNYHPEAEKTLAWDDPDVAIPWPLIPKYISIKDRQGLSLKAIEQLAYS